MAARVRSPAGAINFCCLPAFEWLLLPVHVRPGCSLGSNPTDRSVCARGPGLLVPDCGARAPCLCTASGLWTYGKNTHAVQRNGVGGEGGPRCECAEVFPVLLVSRGQLAPASDATWHVPRAQHTTEDGSARRTPPALQHVLLFGGLASFINTACVWVTSSVVHCQLQMCLGRPGPCCYPIAAIGSAQNLNVVPWCETVLAAAHAGHVRLPALAPYQCPPWPPNSSPPGSSDLTSPSRTPRCRRWCAGEFAKHVPMGVAATTTGLAMAAVTALQPPRRHGAPCTRV